MDAWSTSQLSRQQFQGIFPQDVEQRTRAGWPQGAQPVREALMQLKRLDIEGYARV